MKKTSVYLTDREVRRLRTFAAEGGRSQGHIIREAIATYRAPRRTRDFAISGAWEGDGSSIADVQDDVLMEGFGH